MPTKQEIDKKYNLRPFKDAPPSTQKIDNVIELDSIDLSKFKDGPEGLEARKELAGQLEESLTHYGFFKLIGHGISEDTFNLLKSIAQSAFELPDEEKLKYLGGSNPIEQEKHRGLGVVRGSGFKPRGYWTYVDDVKDNVELLNFRNWLHDEIYYSVDYPEFVKFHLDDVQAYFKYLHNQVLVKVLRLFDIILEFPEGTLYDRYFAIHGNDIVTSGNGTARLLMYHETSAEYNAKTSNTWMRGHSDQSALTFIASQPILSLQIQDYETKKWNYVTHTPNALIVNVGDAFQQFTGGFFRSSIHRVSTAPEDQRSYKRCTIIYFCNPRLDVYIDPESLASPRLDKLGIKSPEGLERLTFGQWDDAKGQFFNNSASRKEPLKLFGRESIASIIDPGQGQTQEVS